jgi:glycosyltransferase involved in cell wall biosynthesis
LFLESNAFWSAHPGVTRIVKYSICITHKNNAGTLEASLDSVLSQIDEDFEVIVVDAQSTDGSLEKLKGYSERGKIKLIVAECSRGKGREIALENSTGEYVISNIDMDEVYRPRLGELLVFYHVKCEGRVLLAVHDAARDMVGFQNVTITSRTTAIALGGWHDLQYGEDWEFWARAAKKGEFSWTAFPLITTVNYHVERMTGPTMARYRFVRYRDSIRAGRRVFSPDEEVTLSQRAFYLLARCAAPFYSSYADPFYRTFKCYDRRYLVE